MNFPQFPDHPDSGPIPEFDEILDKEYKMPKRKADDAPVGSGAASKAASTLKKRRKRQRSRLDEIMASMPTRDNKGK